MARRENKSRFALLGILTYGPMTGYDIKKVYEKGPGHFWQESYGQIYPILRKMAAEGLVERRVEFQEGRPARKVYTLTDAGWAALRAWLPEPVEWQTPRYEILLKLFMGRHAAPEVSLAHVQAARERLTSELGSYDRIEQNIRDCLDETPDGPYHLAVLSYGQHLVRGLLDWCDEAQGLLERLPKRSRGPSSGPGAGANEGAVPPSGPPGPDASGS